MSNARKTQGTPASISTPRSHHTRGLEARFGSRFWDEVECELEAMDVADFQEFLDAEALPIEPCPKFRAQLSGYLQNLVRARFAQ